MIVYVSHPYGGNQENKLKIEHIIRTLSIEKPFDTFVSPVHCFGFMYNDVAYNVGIRYCLDLLDRCDMMLVFGDYMNSKGCRLEIEHAKEQGIPFRIYGDV